MVWVSCMRLVHVRGGGSGRHARSTHCVSALQVPLLAQSGFITVVEIFRAHCCLPLPSLGFTVVSDTMPKLQNATLEVVSERNVLQWF